MICGVVDKISLPFFYRLAKDLKPLVESTVSENTNKIALTLASFSADGAVRRLFAALPTLTVCRQAGDRLRDECAVWLEELNKSQDKLGTTPLTIEEQIRGRSMVNAATTFETVLLEELHTLATYHATPKGIYSTADLIERAEDVFPEEIKKKLSPEAVKDVRESGRCLAFDTATAAGFHILRATESVLHQYYVAVCTPADPNKPLDNWGQYVIELKKKVADPDVQRVALIIDNLREHERNVIMHPEIFLSPDDAFTIFEVAQGAIMAMASRLP